MTRKLPTGWRRVRLGEVLEPVERVEPVNPNVIYSLLGVRLYANGCHLHTEISGTQLKTKTLSRVRAGDVTYNKMWTSKGAFGVVGKEQDGFAATSEYPLFAPRNGALVPDYLGQVFARPHFWEAARALCRGTTQRARLNPRDFLRLEVILPQPAAQRRIVDALRVMDDAIRASEEVLERTRAFKKALAHELLTRGLPGRHQRFKDSPLGEIPAGWEVKKLGEVAYVQTGMAKNKDRHAQGTIEVPYLRVANVQDGFVDLTELKTIRVQPRDVKRHGLQSGDVLMTEGGDNDKLGRGCVWDATVSPCIHQNHVFAVRCKDRLKPQFLALHAASPRGRKYFQDASKQTTNLASVNATQLRALPVPLPSEEEQDALVELLAGVTDTYGSRLSWKDTLLKQRDLLRDAFLAGALGDVA